MLGGSGLLHIILLSPRIRRHLRRNTSMVRHEGLLSSSVRKAFSKESVARIEGLLWGSAQNTLYFLSGLAQETFQAQHRESPLRLGLDDLPPLGFGTRISYLARPHITPCRRFTMGVLLIGMAYGCTTAICRHLQFHTIIHLWWRSLIVKATVESGKLRRLELREKIIRHWVTFPTKIDKFYHCDWGGGPRAPLGGRTQHWGPRATPKVYKLTPMHILDT